VAVIDPKFHDTFGVPLPLSAEDVARALDGLQQRVGAVLVTSPTYEGLCADLVAIANVRLYTCAMQ
jgi:arginine/lysine/ornithine decarboxylase